MKKAFTFVAFTFVAVFIASALSAAPPASFSVTVRGEGRPMILIPGLSSPGEVWDETIDHYAATYQCHRLTLAGFAGEKPIDGELLPRVRRDIATYIKEQKLHKPVIIGHSLGGFLALWLAATEPDLVGPVVVVDGAPALGTFMNPNAKPEDIVAQAKMLEQMLASQTAEQFAMQTKMSLTQMITKREDVDRIAVSAMKSDPVTVGRAMREALTNDIREILPRIRTRALLIAAAGGAADATVKLIEERYEAQIANIPQHEVVVAKNARHFVMLDDPLFLFMTVDRFLGVGVAIRNTITEGR